MNIRTPQPAQAARLLQSFFAAQGITIKYMQALEAVARMNGYLDLQAMKADARFADPMAVTAVSSNELELRENEHSVWIGVDGISVCVTRNDEGVSVDLYAKGHEDNSLEGTYLHFQEALDSIEPDEDGDGEDEKETRDSVAPQVVEKAKPHVLDGPGTWGVRGNAADFPCSEIELTPSQPCVLFAATLVNWARVPDARMTHLRLDAGPVRELSLVKPAELVYLATHPHLSSNEEMTRMVAFAYPEEENRHHLRFLMLSMLRTAVESAPGVIDLVDGRKLELLVKGKDGQLKRYSPALNGLVSID